MWLRRHLLPKGYRRAPAGNFEAGPRGTDGMQYVQGIFHVEHIKLSEQELNLCYGEFPLDWIS